jgi:hypothetical protein
MNWASKGPHFSGSPASSNNRSQPILFLCFIDDLFKSTDLLALMFADEACCLDSDENLDDLIHRVNVEKKTKISVVQTVKSNKSIPARPNIQWWASYF